MIISQKFNRAKYKEFISGWQQQDKFLALLKLSFVKRVDNV